MEVAITSIIPNNITLNDIYSVHKMFIENARKTKQYSLCKFWNDLKENNPFLPKLIELNELKYIIGVLNLRTVNRESMCVINDDLFQIMNYLFSLSYVVNEYRLRNVRRKLIDDFM